MYEIRHRIGIDAPQEQVHQTLSTIEGVRSWWTTDSQGDAAEGGKIVFTFGGPDRSVTVEVLEVNPDRIVWKVIAGPDEWADNTFAFNLSREDRQTVLLFVHDGWREISPFMGHCTTKWGTFLLGAKSLLEGGSSVSYPDEIVISSWDH